MEKAEKARREVIYVVHLNVKEFALKCAGKQKQEHQKFIT